MSEKESLQSACSTNNDVWSWNVLANKEDGANIGLHVKSHGEKLPKHHVKRKQEKIKYQREN